MKALDSQLDDFAGVGAAKPRAPRAKHVGAFSKDQPAPGEEPLPPTAALAGVPHVATAISAVMAEIMRIGIGKTHKNAQQNYSFRGIDDVYNILPEYLVKHRLVIVPHVEERTCVERQARGGGTLNYVTVKMEFDLISTLDGSRERASSFGEAMDSGDKATNKALSTAYKYMATQVFCIPTIGIDTEEDTYEVAATKPTAKPPAASLPPAAGNGQQPTLREKIAAHTREKRGAALTEMQATLPDPDDDDDDRRNQGPAQNIVLRQTAKAMAVKGATEYRRWYGERDQQERHVLDRNEPIRALTAEAMAAGGEAALKPWWNGLDPKFRNGLDRMGLIMKARAADEAPP